MDYFSVRLLRNENLTNAFFDILSMVINEWKSHSVEHEKVAGAWMFRQQVTFRELKEKAIKYLPDGVQKPVNLCWLWRKTVKGSNQ